MQAGILVWEKYLPSSRNCWASPIFPFLDFRKVWRRGALSSENPFLRAISTATSAQLSTREDRKCNNMNHAEDATYQGYHCYCLVEQRWVRRDNQQTLLLLRKWKTWSSKQIFLENIPTDIQKVMCFFQISISRCYQPLKKRRECAWNAIFASHLISPI